MASLRFQRFFKGGGLHWRLSLSCQGLGTLVGPQRHAHVRAARVPVPLYNLAPGAKASTRREHLNERFREKSEDTKLP